jgi:hypothetical protein
MRHTSLAMSAVVACCVKRRINGDKCHDYNYIEILLHLMRKVTSPLLWRLEVRSDAAGGD